MIAQVVFLFVAIIIHETHGHGMMLNPPGRSSLWRTNPIASPNYQDNQLFCGGAYVQNEVNGGKCGVCGDPYTDPHPQPNENTGTYGKGIIAGRYEAGSIIDVEVQLTANHLGTFTYSICKLQDHNAPESGEKCFNNLELADGSLNYVVRESDKTVKNQVKLPDIECERCVLRWTYRCGNNWGVCDDGNWRPGCGPQEHFRSCADITIYPRVPQAPPV